MSALLKDLIKLGITAGLSNREAFVKKVSGIIEEYQHNPAAADKLANGVADYLQQWGEDLRMQSAIRGSISDANLPDKDSIQELTKAIKKLTDQLNK